MVYPKDLDELAELIRSDPIANTPGDATGYAMLHLDTKTFSEAASYPRTRMPPVPKELYEKGTEGIAWGMQA